MKDSIPSERPGLTFRATARRLVVLAIWVLGAWVMGILLFCLAGWGYIYATQHWQWPPLVKWLPEWVIGVVFFGAFLLPPVVALLLGLYEKLPGTSPRRPPEPRGFTIGPWKK
jgi:MFS family permease